MAWLSGYETRMHPDLISSRGPANWQNYMGTPPTGVIISVVLRSQPLPVQATGGSGGLTVVGFFQDLPEVDG